MKLPSSPPLWRVLFDREGESILRLVSDKAVSDKISEFNKNYLFWDELRYRTKDDLEQKYYWAFMKFLRSDRYERIPYKPMELKYTVLPEISRELHKFDKYLAGNIEVQSKTLGLEKRYVVSSLMEEAIATSILEGAATTRKIAKEMLRQKRKPRNRDEQMIVNGYETMQFIAKKKSEKLTPELILGIQRSITKDTLEREDYGCFRSSNDIVVADPMDSEIVYHTPPDYTEVEGLIKELCDFANNDVGDFIHPIIKASVLHFLVGYIHPFNDGNGRTARSIFYWYLLSRDYWLFEYMSVSRRILKSKKEYKLVYLYSEYDEPGDMDLTYFIKFIVKCVEDSLNDLQEYIKKKQGEQTEAKRILGEIGGLNFRQASILEEMMENPDKYYTIEEISQTYHTVYQTARTDLQYLADKGYLKMKKVSKKFTYLCDRECREKLTKA